MQFSSILLEAENYHCSLTVLSHVGHEVLQHPVDRSFLNFGNHTPINRGDILGRNSNFTVLITLKQVIELCPKIFFNDQCRTISADVTSSFIDQVQIV